MRTPFYKLIVIALLIIFCTSTAKAQFLWGSKTITINSSYTIIFDAHKSELSAPWTKRGTSSAPLYYMVVNADGKTITSYTESGTITVSNIVDIIITSNEIKYFTYFPMPSKSIDDSPVSVLTVKKHNGEWILEYTYSRGRGTSYERIKSIENIRNN